MHDLWHWLLYVLAWSSSDAGMLEAERARTAGSVAVAYATLAQDAPPPAPQPKPEDAASAQEDPKCPKCDGTGRIYRPDGGWVKCSCSCPSGRCPTTKR